jgi:hypothetical protein
VRLPVVLIALPWFASELVALLIGAVVALMVVLARRKPTLDLMPYDTADARFAELQCKVQHPWTYRARQWAKD